MHAVANTTKAPDTPEKRVVHGVLITFTTAEIADEAAQLISGSFGFTTAVVEFNSDIDPTVLRAKVGYQANVVTLGGGGDVE